MHTVTTHPTTSFRRAVCGFLSRVHRFTLFRVSEVAVDWRLLRVRSERVLGQDWRIQWPGRRCPRRELFDLVGTRPSSLEHLRFHKDETPRAVYDGLLRNAEIQYAMFVTAERIDVAIVPFWYLTDRNDAVRRAIGARRWIATHIPPADAEAIRRQVLEAVPGAVVLIAPGERHSLP